jgi:hypothetical protein
MYNNYEETRAYVASGDLSALQFRAIDLVGQFRIGHATAGRALGILLNKPLANEHATVAIRGEVQVRVGSGGVAVGDQVTSTLSGWVQKTTAGEIVDNLGRAVTAAASGHLAVVDLNVTRTSS